MSINPHVFVYGSLLSSAGHPMGARLAAEATLVGAATIPGRLYRVGWYPGLRPAERQDEIVHGEVWRLADPDRTLAWLDAYEGIDPGGAREGDEYDRVEREVRLDAGPTLTAWVYVYRRPLPDAQRVANGRWRG